MAEVIMVGCDLHAKTLVLKWARGTEKACLQRFPNTFPARKALLEWLKGRAAEAGAARIVFAYEASGQGYQLYDELSGAGVECYVVPPTKLQRSDKQRKNKNDNADAQALLELLRGFVLAGNPMPAVRVPGRQQRDDQELTRCREDLAHKLAGIKIQIGSLLKRNGVERPSELGVGWNKKQQTWLKELSSRSWKQERPGAAAALATLLRQAAALECELKILEREIKQLAGEERHAKKVEALTKLEGIGILSAVTFLTEMGSMTRFNNRRQVGAYLGLAPSSWESGESKDRKGHITRQGSGRLRRMLNQCVWSRIRTDTTEAGVYERIKAKNPKKTKIAVVALMRRLAIRMWHAAASA